MDLLHGDIFALVNVSSPHHPTVEKTLLQSRRSVFSHTTTTLWLQQEHVPRYTLRPLSHGRSRFQTLVHRTRLAYAATFVQAFELPGNHRRQVAYDYNIVDPSLSWDLPPIPARRSLQATTNGSLMAA